MIWTIVVTLIVLALLFAASWISYTRNCPTDRIGAAKDCGGSGGCCRHGYLGYYIN